MPLVYRHRRLDNDVVFYIGIAKKKSRPYSKDNRNNHWKNIVSKYGYYVEILLDGLTWEEACELEILLISIYGRHDKKEGTLVNLTNGGDGVVGQIISEKNRRITSERCKQNIGEKNPNYGKPNLTLQLYNKTNKGINHSNYGRKNPSHSEKKKGKGNPFYGKKHSDEFKKLKGRRVLDTSTNIEYYSMKYASEMLGLNLSTLQWMLYNPEKNKTTLVLIGEAKTKMDKIG